MIIVFLRLFISLLLLTRIRILLTLEAISATLTESGTTDPHILIFIEPAAKLLHQQELSGLNASWNADDVDEDQEYADGKLGVFPADIVYAVTDFRGTVCLLAACFSAIHTSFKV